MLKAYKDEKSKILEQYEELLTLSHMFPKNITLEDIKEKRKQLEEEHFLVSFTGQIKAGKSTLINALLFGDEVIPADDTPHTAKITIIKYGEIARLEATFYNKEEWRTLQSNQTFYQEFLEADIEKSIHKGLFVDELIYASAKIQKEEGLENLKEYVARDGKYTPFVNIVTLYYPSEILKEITVVDTPGTNDPNKLRDKVAKEWIHKTNANVYITYANQAMDKVDIDFIDNFLLSVPKEQKLTVINKIDSVNDREGLEEYIYELLSEESLQRREIVSDRESLVLVSGLGALIDKMLLNDLELNDDLNYYAQQLEEKGFLEPENHKLITLEKMIEQKLIENKGKNILEAHSTFLNSIFLQRIKELEKSLETTKDTLFDLIKSKSELEHTKQSIIEILDFIAREQDQIEKKFIDFIKKSMDDFYGMQVAQNRVSIAYIEKEIYAINNTANYKNEIPWIIKESIDNNFDKVRENMRIIIDTLTQKIQKNMDRLKEDLITRDKAISLKLTSQTFNIYAMELIAGMKELVESHFQQEEINLIVEKNANVIQRLFNTKGGLSKINIAIMNEIKLFFEIRPNLSSSNNLQEKFEMMLTQHIQDNILQKLMVELTQIMTTKTEEINGYIQNEKDKDILIKEATGEKLSLEKKLEEIKVILKGSV